jgi:uncharacterized membrane protein (UPF0127 family)
MGNKRFLILAVAILIIIALIALAASVCAYTDYCSLGSALAPVHYGPSLVIGVLNQTSKSTTDYDVYTAQTMGEWTYGLMNYEFSCAIPNGCINGMLFLFPNESEQCFWMKNTTEPLTQIWIGTNGLVTAVYNATPEDTTTICHEGEAVLELYRYLPGRVTVGDSLPGGIAAIKSGIAGLAP